MFCVTHPHPRFKLPQGHAQTEIISFGKRLTGPDALKLGVVQAVGTAESLLDKAKEVVMSSLALGALSRDSLGWMKRDLYRDILAKVDTEFLPYMISKL